MILKQTPAQSFDIISLNFVTKHKIKNKSI